MPVYKGLRRPVVGGTRRVATGRMRVQGVPSPHERGVRVKLDGPWHSLTAKSSDRKSMRGYMQLGDRAWGFFPFVQREEEIATYLSNTPSVSPTLPGPATAPQWRSDTKPESHGMRTSNSRRPDVQDHSLMLTIGRLDAG